MRQGIEQRRFQHFALVRGLGVAGVLDGRAFSSVMAHQVARRAGWLRRKRPDQRQAFPGYGLPGGRAR